MATQNSVGNGLTGATGSGSFVGSTGPTFDTIISIPNDPGAFPAAAIVQGANINVTGALRLVSSSNNSNQTSGAGTGYHASVGVLGTNYQDGYIWQRFSSTGDGGSLRITKGRGTSANPIVYDDAIKIENNNGVGLITLGDSSFTSFSCEIRGVTTATNAAAGIIGQELTTTRIIGSALSLTTGTAASITSVTLTNGDWDIWGNIGFIAASGTLITSITGSINSVAATQATAPNDGAFCKKQIDFPASTTQIIPVGTKNISVSGGSQIYYLVATAVFSVSTCTAYGNITARRRR